MVKKHNTINKKQVKESKTTVIISILLGIILGGLIVYGVYSLVQQPKIDLSTYNGFAFKHHSNGKEEFWTTQVELNGNLYEVPFYHHPTELENYEFDDRVTDYLLRNGIQKIILAVRPDAGSIPVLAGVNIARVTGKFYGIPTSSALYVPENETSDINLTQVNCGDAIGPVPIIWLSNKTVEPSVVLSDDEHFCIYVSGVDKNILAASDLLAYKLLGIMK